MGNLIWTRLLSRFRLFKISENEMKKVLRILVLILVAAFLVRITVLKYYDEKGTYIIL